jgi:TonB family protein
MAHSPKMLPDSLEPADLIAAVYPAKASPTPHTQATVAQMSSALADQGIEGTELALDLILHDIAERARQATGASGAAIAIQQEDAMVCRGAAGATVPDLGARINTQNGLSGACVRTGEPQWCNDSDSDERVDADACRELGVRSLVVVPVFAGDTLVGVVEVFSPEPQAFREQDLHTLQDLAQWVTEAVHGASGTASARQQGLSVVGGAPPAVTLSQLASRSGAYSFIARSTGRALSNRILRLSTVVVAVLLCSLVAFRWGWQKAHSDASATTQTRPQPGSAARELASSQLGSASGSSVTPSGTDPAARHPVAPKPDAGKLRGGLTVYDKGSVIYQQVPRPAETQKDFKSQPVHPPSELAIPYQSDPSSAVGLVDGDTQRATDASSQPTTVQSAPLSEKSEPGASADPSAASTVVPAAIRVSQGVKEGRLIRRVDPRYPPAALLQRIEGSVVLQAVVGKDGRVRETKAVDGNSYLTQAALDAVRQWRYEPYTLNGEPIDMKTEITINFKLPK